MTVIYTRIGRPNPGRQVEALQFAKKRAEAINSLYGAKQEVALRFGGPLGEIVSIARHDKLSELEDIKRKVVADTTAGKIPTSPPGVFEQVEEHVWLVQ
jgi:hypothetical protein